MSRDIELCQAYHAGWRDGVTELAQWKDGKEVVGVEERPLKEVLEKDRAAERKELAKIKKWDEAWESDGG